MVAHQAGSDQSVNKGYIMAESDSILLTKVCTCCAAQKTLDAFCKQKTGKYGVRSVCRECRRRELIKPPGYWSAIYAGRKHQDNARDRYEQRRRDRQQNPAKFNARAMHRAAMKKQATPEWADAAAILAVYERAAQMKAETGDKFHVDHIVPLQSRIVCGLHVHWNMQILPALENISKGNRIWPDMP